MTPASELACLVIADVSGYTRYLTGVELDHAQDIMADLIGTVVGALQPSFALAGLEGDAVFAYSPTAVVDGSVLLDVIEGTYFAFRRRLAAIERATNCDCDACRRLPILDLKVVAHHGTILRHQVAGREELLGADVIVLHRLLKNDVAERTGLNAYALITEACLATTSLDPARLEMTRTCQSYDLGEVCGWVHDLHRAWEEERRARRVFLDEAEAMFTVSREVSAPPMKLFELATSPVHRPVWARGPMEIRENSPSSRRGVGTVNHCIHGQEAVLEEVLDWRPPDYWTVRFELPGVLTALMTDEIVAVEGGSRITSRIRIEGPEELPHLDDFLAGLSGQVTAAMDGLVEFIHGTGPDPGLPAAASLGGP
jgi:hypothetical protein